MYNILIVDDSRTIRSVIAKTLDIAGVKITTLHEAANGKEALDILLAEWVDIVFADINMPVMSGMELVDEMKTAGMLETVPVVIISTEGSRQRIDELKNKGVRAYLRKPFTPEQLIAVIDEVLGPQSKE
jgi:two-component system chemotaxis response regulator CheY